MVLLHGTSLPPRLFDMSSRLARGYAAQRLVDAVEQGLPANDMNGAGTQTYHVQHHEIAVTAYRLGRMVSLHRWWL